MIGIAFDLPRPEDVERWGWQPGTPVVARIEPGPEIVLRDGRNIKYYWRRWEPSPEERTRLMEQVIETAGFRPREIDGFSLWHNWTKGNWQMNVRRRGESGWDVSHISEEQAKAIFKMLEESTDGPWKLSEEFIRQMEQESTLVRTETWPYVKRRELPLDEALRRCREAVERGNELLATLLPAD